MIFPKSNGKSDASGGGKYVVLDFFSLREYYILSITITMPSKR